MNTVIITGGSRGIGAETCRLFAQSGFNVVINYNKSKQRAEALKDELTQIGCNAVTFCADISKFAECQALTNFAIEKFKHVDVLVNNAGIADIKPFTDVSEADFERVMNVNFKGMFFMCKAVVPHMISAQKGKVVNISSVWGMAGSSCETVYCASKAAVIGFSKALAKELGPSNINVNCVAPGYIKTEMNKDIDDDTVSKIVEDTPLMKIGEPKDVAELILFLATEKSKFVTGQVISPNGGWVI